MTVGTKVTGREVSAQRGRAVTLWPKGLGQGHSAKYFQSLACLDWTLFLRSSGSYRQSGADKKGNHQGRS